MAPCTESAEETIWPGLRLRGRSALQSVDERNSLWVTSDRYTIEAKAPGLPGREIMIGPMMRTLLEDRFKLQTHRELKEVPVYALTVAKGGSKLQHAKEGLL